MATGTTDNIVLACPSHDSAPAVKHRWLLTALAGLLVLAAVTVAGGLAATYLPVTYGRVHAVSFGQNSFGQKQ